MDQRRSPATDDAGKAAPAGAPEPRGVPKTDRARTEKVIEGALPPDQQTEPARTG
ncbi:hypothetical protein [Elioraea sp.]|jgi:hypothetical protein|uniref:hypothetical protein n=1 Tax=Elioraea sp. TaxID=2185103 RepID=UPI003F71641E